VELKRGSKAIPKHSVKTKFQGELTILCWEKIAFFIRFGSINIAVVKPDVSGYVDKKITMQLKRAL
jgi:hypothetical protein